MKKKSITIALHTNGGLETLTLEGFAGVEIILHDAQDPGGSLVDKKFLLTVYSGDDGPCLTLEEELDPGIFDELYSYDLRGV